MIFDVCGCVIVIINGCIKINKDRKTLLSESFIDGFNVLDGHATIERASDANSQIEGRY